MISELLEQLLNGLLVGSSYALIALGLTLTYGVMGIVNFAHGEIYMVGAYLAFVFVVSFHINYLLALPLVFVMGLLIGPLVNNLIFEPGRRHQKINTLITSLGLSIVLSNLALLTFGAAPLFLRTPFSETVVSISGLMFSTQRLFVFVLAFLLLTAVWLCLRKTPVSGQESALLAPAFAGIPSRRIRNVTMAVSAGLAATAGALFAPLFVINPFIGNLAGLKAFAVVVVGGFGNIQGTLLAALLLGVVESLATGYVSSAYRDAIAFVILLVVLIVRPKGIIEETSATSL